MVSHEVVATERGDVRVAAGPVAVSARVYDSGVFEVALATSARCERDVVEVRRVREVSRRELTSAGWAAIGWGLFVPVGAFGVHAIASSGSDDEAGTDALPWIGGVVGAALVAVPLVSRFGKTRRETVRDERVVTGAETATCPAGEGGALPEAVTALAPWGAELAAPVDEHGRARFEVDWTATGVDPLADDAPRAVSGAWLLRGDGGAQLAAWTPDAADVTEMLRLIGERTDTQVVVERGGAAPGLRATSFGAADGDGVRSGEEATLSLTIENRGKGAAYRVVVTTHSGLPALRGVRFSFGLIEAGASKTKTARVRLPAQRRDSREAVVVRVEEATGRGPAEVSMPLVVRKARAPSLAVTCELAATVIDPGKAGTVRCDVRNDGEAVARDVAIAAALDGRAVGRSAGVELAVGVTATMAVEVPVPATAQLDDALSIEVTATAANARGATWRATARAGKPPICASKLTQADYEARRARLKKALDAGALTQAEYDEAHGQLVRCLTAE